MSSSSSSSDSSQQFSTGRIIRGDPNSVNLEAILQQQKDAKENEYEIKKPLYPLPEIVKYYKDNGFDYKEVYEKYTSYFPYDASFRNWWKEVRQIARNRKLTQVEPIIREIPVIYRYKLGNNEKIVWSERFRGVSTKTGKDIIFKHIVGVHWVHHIEIEYGEDDVNTPILGGQKKEYSIDFVPTILDELYKYAPLSDPQELIVVIMGRTFGGNGLYQKDEFKDSTVEWLAKVALSAKGLVYTNVRDEIQTQKNDDIRESLKVFMNNPKALDLLTEIFEEKMKQKTQQNTDKNNTNQNKK